MVVGAVVGVVGGRAMLWFIRRCRCPARASTRCGRPACASVRRWPRWPRLGLPGGVRGRHPPGGRARAVQAGDRAVPLGAGQPGRDRGVHRAGAHRGPGRADPTPMWWIPGLVAGVFLALATGRSSPACCLLPPRLPANDPLFVCSRASRAPCPSCWGGFILAAHLPDAERLDGWDRRRWWSCSPSWCRGSLVPAVPGRACCTCPSRGDRDSGPNHGLLVASGLADEPGTCSPSTFTIAEGAPADGQLYRPALGMLGEDRLDQLRRARPPAPARARRMPTAGRRRGSRPCSTRYRRDTINCRLSSPANLRPAVRGRGAPRIGPGEPGIAPADPVEGVHGGGWARTPDTSQTASAACRSATVPQLDRGPPARCRPRGRRAGATVVPGRMPGSSGGRAQCAAGG